MPFSPEQYMSETVSPDTWAQLHHDSNNKLIEIMKERKRADEQTRQFEMEQARLREQQEQEQLKYQSGMTLQKEQLEFQQQKQAFDMAKYGIEQDQEQEAIEREGVKTLLKAWTDAEEVKEFNAAAQMISETHDIIIAPDGDPPPELQAAMPMGPDGAPVEPGMEPPPGTAPEAGGGQEMAVDAQGNRVPINLPAGMPGTPEGKARAKDEQGQIDALPTGPEVTAAGLDASKSITSGAAAVAEATGLSDLGVQSQVDDLPSEPEDAQTAEAAAQADKENPVVDPDQQMPAKDFSELSRRLEKQKPITQVEVDDRVSTDTQVKASYDKRIAQLKAMGLTPIQLAIASNWAAAAHDLPPVAIPSPAPDPNVPPDQQGNGAFDVEIPPEVEQLAKAPPELQPSIVRDGRLNGRFAFWSRRTGKKLGTLDWKEVQEARMRKRLNDWSSLPDIADNERDSERLRTMIELYARNGDKESFRTVMSYIGKLYGREAKQEATERQNSAEARAAVKDMTAEMVRIKGDLFKNEGLDKMKETIQSTDRTLKTLESNPSSTSQRKVMADFLAEMYGRRATDQDANRGLRDSLWTDVLEMKEYVLGSGKLGPKRMQKMKDILVELNQAEKNKRAAMAIYLHEQVMNSLTMQTTDSNLAKSMAQQAVIEAFPDLEHEAVVHAIGESMRRRRERLTGRVGGGEEPPAAGQRGPDEEIPYDELTPDDL